MENITIHGRVIDKRGFEVQFQEFVDHRGIPTYSIFAYSLNGGFIGDIRRALNLIVERGIQPERIDETYDACSIGFNEKEQKWYGWSHRAMYGFGIGYIAKENDIVCSSGWSDEYLKDHPEADKSVPVGFESKTLEDCRILAIAFADSVS
jgi:hypothetical protein